MDHVQANLLSTLGTKSSWVFNCNRVTHRLKKGDNGGRLLFANDALNYLVLTKEMLTHDDPRRLDTSPIGTKLYLPFESDKPEKGGRSIKIHNPKLESFLAEIVGLAAGQDAFANDLMILRTIDALPSLDGFLLRDALLLEGTAPDEAYFEVSAEDRIAIQKFIRGKMEMLVRAAFGEKSTDPNKVTHLIDTVWEAKDLRALEPLILALRCPHNEALSIFAAWKGIMFYSFDYYRTEKQRKDLALWLNKSTNIGAGLPRDHALYLRERVQSVVQRLRNHWVGVDTVLKDYNQLYDNFVISMDPAGFINFLRNANDVSYMVGVSLGKISQAVGCLEMMRKKKSEISAADRGFDDLLGQLNASLAPTAVPKKKAA
jgi:hypothetical protein